MKVVLFCGGLGTRLREHSEVIPKPLVSIGYRPILWHIMRYYAHFGHTDFILCLGYRGNLIKEFFLRYDETTSNDFVMRNGGKDVELLNRDIDDWTITFVDTGLQASVGERLRAVRHLLAGEDWFLANYSDGLSDLQLDAFIDEGQRRDAVGSLVAVRTAQSFHSVDTKDGLVTSFGKVRDSDFWVNGGFFLFRRSIFDDIRPAEDLVEQPFDRLIARQQLYAHHHEGFWQSMDTFKDKIAFDQMYERGVAPWELWRTSPRATIVHS